MNVLVLSPCSRSKRFDPVVQCEGIDTESRSKLVDRHRNCVTTAAEMYTGGEHEAVREAVEELRSIADVDWRIVSAGFGILRDDTKIPSYECGFSRENIESVRARADRAGYDVDKLTNDEAIRAVGREKGIPDEVARLVFRGYDLIFVVLSEPYLLAVSEGLTKIPEGTTAFAYASDGSKHLVDDCEWVPATEEERSALSTTWMRLRGELLRTFASRVDSRRLQEVKTDSNLVGELSTESSLG